MEVNRAQSRRPKDGAFFQQQLKAWQPILTPKAVIITFLSIGVVFLAFGIFLKALSDAVVEYSLQYDGAGTPVELSSCMLSGAGGRQCQLSFNIQERMKAPVYVYYELDNFYQNHRRYVKSRSDAQLRGQELPASSLSDCEPLIRNETGHVLNPCGLIANSFFNDTFLVATGGVVMDETGIAWKSDREKKFKKPAVYLPTVHYLHQTYPSIITPEQGVENEHFIVWMRTAALPNFRKLYGRIEQDLDANTVLTFNVTANYRVDEFRGKKSLVISTTSWFGGRNPFLGIAYMAVGSVCLVLGLLFWLKHWRDPRSLGDEKRLRWRRE